MGTVVNDCAASCPTGSRVSGGGCEAHGARPWAIYQSLASSNGWSCRAYEPLSVGNGNFVPDGSVTAQAMCASPVMAPAAKWATVASNRIAIARAGIGFETTIERAFMVCNTDGPDAVTAIVYRSTDQHPEGEVVSGVPPIDKGKCLLVDRPSALFLVDYVHSDKANSGFYRTFAPGSFDLGGAPFALIAQDADTIPSAPSAARPVPALCEPVANPNPQQGIYATCAIPSLTKGGSYRICFGTKYTPPMSNGDSYTGTQLPLVTDPALLAKPLPATPDELIYNPIVPGGCRDIYNVTSATALNFIVWPYKAMPPDSVWQPQLVTMVTLTLEGL